MASASTGGRARRTTAFCMWQAAQNSSSTGANVEEIRNAVMKMQNKKVFSASYGHAYIRYGTPHVFHVQHHVLICLQLCSAISKCTAIMHH